MGLFNKEITAVEKPQTNKTNDIEIKSSNGYDAIRGMSRPFRLRSGASGYFFKPMSHKLRSFGPNFLGSCLYVGGFAPRK